MTISDVVRHLARLVPAEDRGSPGAWVVGAGLRIAFSVWAFGSWTPFGFDRFVPGLPWWVNVLGLVGCGGSALSRRRHHDEQPADPPRSVD